jgi:branched-chain amino acid aminotransferase
MKSEYIWIDGEFFPYEQANVHFLTPTLHYGVGVFEGIRCYQTSTGPAVFRLRDHLARFIESIHILGVTDFHYSIDDLTSAVFDVINKNKLKECYIRPLMYLDGPLGMNMDLSKPKVGIAAWEWGPYLGEDAQKTEYI